MIPNQVFPAQDLLSQCALDHRAQTLDSKLSSLGMPTVWKCLGANLSPQLSETKTIGLGETRNTYQWSHRSSNRPRWVPISVKHSGSAVSAPEFWPNRKNTLQPSRNLMKLLVWWEIDIESLLISLRWREIITVTDWLLLLLSYVLNYHSGDPQKLTYVDSEIRWWVTNDVLLRRSSLSSLSSSSSS